LAIVHRIVVAHSGRVEIESSSGTGSLFRVVLPRAGAAREHA
jgi:signal transduction histidine kinase